MANLVNAIKKFVGNKNTVTILGVLAGVIVLWFFYSYRVKEATSPTKIPYAKEAIYATEPILPDNVGTVEVSSKFLKTADVYRTTGEVINKYVNVGTSIPAGGIFYRAQVVEKNQLPNTIFDDIEDGYTPFSLGVNNHTTYGNSIYPGDKIDLYLKAPDEDAGSGKFIYGKFIEKITVLAVRDSAGKNVFDSETPKNPAELVFAVDDNMYLLLKRASYLSGLEIVPVPRNKHYTSEGGEVQTLDFWKEYIASRTTYIPGEDNE